LLNGRGNDAKNDWKTEEVPAWAVLEAMIEAVSGLKLSIRASRHRDLTPVLILELLLKTWRI
jgi:hypothetical protein